MKTFIKSTGLLALCAPVLFSCNNDLDGIASGNTVPVELSLQVNGMNTRTSTSLDENEKLLTTWSNNDLVGLFLNNGIHSVYTTTDEGQTWSDRKSVV